MSLNIRRLRKIRDIENSIRFGNKQYISLGERNGNFFIPGWKTLDLIDADYLVDLRNSRLPFTDDSVEAFHSSQLIEHLTLDDGRKMFQEQYRCLKPGGYLRIVTPDLEKFIDRYRVGDWSWFFRNHADFVIRQIRDGILPPEHILPHNFLVRWLASYSGRIEAGGGPLVAKEVVDRKLSELDNHGFRKWCVSLLEPGRTRAHLHVYDYPELSGVLLEIGFSSVKRTEIGESDCAEMKNVDRLDQGEFSICAEARK